MSNPQTRENGRRGTADVVPGARVGVTTGATVVDLELVSLVGDEVRVSVRRLSLGQLDIGDREGEAAMLEGGKGKPLQFRRTLQLQRAWGWPRRAEQPRRRR